MRVLVHWLLTKCVKDEYVRKMNSALAHMGRAKSGRNRTSWQYEQSKVAARYAQKGKLASFETKIRMKVAAKLRQTPEARAKISKALKGYKRTTPTVEHRAKISATLKGRKGNMPSPEGIARIRISKMGNKHWLGKNHSLESRIKMSKVRTGEKRTLETRANISKSKMGFRHTAEAKARIGAASSARKRTEETKAKMRLSMTGKKHTEETKRKLSVTVSRWHRQQFSEFASVCGI